MSLSLALAVLGLQAGEIFKSEEGRFQAWYPSPPVYQKKADESDPKFDSHKHRVSRDEIDLLISYQDNPAPVDIDAFAKKVKAHYIESKWKIQKDAKISLGKHKGLTFTLLNADGTMIQQRVYFVGVRMYQVIATTEKATHKHPDVPKFFDGFKIADEGK